ncbi:MAG TPA: glycosyltransferase family 4 protein [Methanomassiliicoccales archaeon]|nr:glycosyltransferase family 4 protein [Methanomassiliicoccales archaeon]
MKILVVSKFYPPVIGGVEVTVKELCEEYVRKGQEVTAVVMTKGDFEDRAVNGVRVLRFPSDRLLLGGFNRGVLSFMKETLRPEEYDIVHVHNFHILLSFQSAMMCALRDMPYVFSPHYHGKGHTVARDMLFQGYRRLGRIGLSRAQAVTCASEYEKGKLLKDFPDLREKAVVISPGITERRKSSRERDVDSLLFVGRLMRYKGLDHAFLAMKVLKERGRRVRLRVVGTGPDEPELRRLASELQLEGQVEFLGEVGEDVLTEEYALASCLLLLSSAEAYGLVVAEALASGTPCIVAKAGALTEFTLEPGCLGVDYPPKPEDVADAIMSVLDRGPSLKVGPFSQKISYWPEVAARYLQLYESVLKARRSS